MITKQGYVFIAAFNGPMGLVEHLFGPPKEGKNELCDNLQLNGLNLFDKENQAMRIMKGYVERMQWAPDYDKTTLAYLWLKIADNMGEAKKIFSKSRDLVVIASDHEPCGVGDILMGRRVEGKQHQYPLYGARMVFNGFAPIKEFNSAEYIASEAARQGQYRVKIARFKLKRLEEK